MPADWAVEEVRAAVARAFHVESTQDDGYQVLHIEVTDAIVELGFRARRDPTTYAASFSFAAPRFGRSTGEPCATPEQWAREVRMFLDEEIGTLDLYRRRLTTKADGRIVVEWEGES